MLGTKAKDVSSSSGGAGRFGAVGAGADVMRVFNRALELVSSNSTESENELLDLVKRAKRETEKEPFHLSKKVRSGRGSGEPSSEVVQALGHRSAVISPTPPDNNTSTIQVAGGGGDGGSGAIAIGGGNANMTQGRSINVFRVSSGPSRGRIEKPKRKAAR